MTTDFATDAACGSTTKNIAVFDALWAAKNKKTRSTYRAKAARICASCPLARPEKGTRPCPERIVE